MVWKNYLCIPVNNVQPKTIFQLNTNFQTNFYPIIDKNLIESNSIILDGEIYYIAKSLTLKKVI